MPAIPKLIEQSPICHANPKHQKISTVLHDLALQLKNKTQHAGLYDYNVSKCSHYDKNDKWQIPRCRIRDHAHAEYGSRQLEHGKELETINEGAKHHCFEKSDTYHSHFGEKAERVALAAGPYSLI